MDDVHSKRLEVEYGKEHTSHGNRPRQLPYAEFYVS